jgi:hypothetical protein
VTTTSTIISPPHPRTTYSERQISEKECEVNRSLFFDESYLREHQLKAVWDLENGCILKGGVGTGKTRVAAAYYKLVEAPKDVYVITTAKKRDDFDWQDEFYRLDVGPKSGPPQKLVGRGAARGAKVPPAVAEGGRGRAAQQEGGIGAGSVGQGDPGGRGSVHDDRLGESPGLHAGGAPDPSRVVPEYEVVDGSGSGISDELLQEINSISGPDQGAESSGVSGGDSRFRYTLTVDSWNNINKYAGVKGAFFIFDEQRLVGSGRWVKTFLKLARHNNWILLSATPGDTWLDYVPVFIANGFYKNRTEFKQAHVVYSAYSQFPKVERYLNVGKLVRLRNLVTVDMSFVRETSRELVPVEVEHDRESLDLVLKKRWDVFNDEPIVDAAGLFRVARRLINSHSSRIDAVYRLMQKHDKLIIFYNFNYELDMLRELAQFRKVAEWNGHKHEKIPDDDQWLYLVQYTAGAEGWNCIQTDAMIFFSLQYSWKIWEQCQGRIDRLNTPFKKLYYYYLMSKTGVDRTIWTSIKNKEDFNESRYFRAIAPPQYGLAG